MTIRQSSKRGFWLCIDWSNDSDDIIGYFNNAEDMWFESFGLASGTMVLILKGIDR